MTDCNRGSGGQPCGVFPSRRSYEPANADGIDPAAILTKVDTLQIRAWRYTPEDGAPVEHVGPAAEAFYETFEFGKDADRITVGDPAGVALAAIQGLNARVDEQTARVRRQAQQISEQQKIIAEQRDDIESLREHLEALQAEVARIRSDVDAKR